MALTDAGQRLLDNAGAAVDQALESLKSVKAKHGEVTGRVRLSVPSAAVTLVLARLIRSFIERSPKVELDARVEDQLGTRSQRASSTYTREAWFSAPAR